MRNTWRIVLGLLTITMLGGAATTPTYAQDRRDFLDFLRGGGRWDVRDALDLMDLAHLDRGQRDKIRWLVRRYDGKIRDVRKDDDMRPSRKVDRVWELQAELRRRIIIVLRRDQRDALRDLLERDRLPRGIFGEDAREWLRALDDVGNRD